MSRFYVTRAALAAAILGLAACASSEPRDPRLAQPLPPPGPVSPVVQGPLATVPGEDAVLRGVAFAETGDGRFPPNSRLILRVYDAARGDVNRPVIERTYTRSGQMPWPYELRVPLEVVEGLESPAVAARLEGPRGQLIYRSTEAVVLTRGGSEDIAMQAVGGLGVDLPTAVRAEESYIGAPLSPSPQPKYGIPDYRDRIGTPNYDTPVHQGEIYNQPSISGPPKGNF